MISKGHKKHSTITRPALGNYSRNEWAITGGFCTTIKLLADQVIGALSPHYKCAYIDATHSDELVAPPGRLAAGAVMEYIDQSNHQQVNYNAEFTPFKLRQLFAETDMVLVNGNHHQAKAQVVIIDWSKEASLQKRLAQLTNVQLFILGDNADDVFDFIKEAIPHWEQIPICKIDEIEKITGFFAVRMQQARPILNGLVLAGGQSTRMGFDKSKANWNGREQRYHVADMLKVFCNEVFISRSSGQQLVDERYPSITDTFTGLGPYGAILSAFREQPESAWLIVACDLPLLDMETLRYLVENRDTSATATAYGNGFENLPEPLITIWEPKSYSLLLSFLAQGYSCPRKVLINSDSRLLMAVDKSTLTNVNTPEDLEKIKKLLEKTHA